MSRRNHPSVDRPVLEWLEARLLLSTAVVPAPAPGSEWAPSRQAAVPATLTPDIHLTVGDQASSPPAVAVIGVNGRPGRSACSIDPSGAGVRTITVRFGEPVDFGEAGVLVEAVAFPRGAENVIATLEPAGVAGSGTDTMVLTFGAGAIVDTWVKVTLKASTIASLSGQALDGEARGAGQESPYIYDAATDLPTGDGVPGGDAVFYVGSLWGDFDADGLVTERDVDGFCAAYGSGDADADFRGVGTGSDEPDGRITPSDIDAFVRVYQEATAAGRHLDPVAVNHAPALPGQSFSVAEAAPNETVVATVAASDPDVGQTLAYAIVGGNTDNAFAIDPSTGRISVANSGALDFETTPTFALAVQVTDDGAPPLSALATVTIVVNAGPAARNDAYSLDADTVLSVEAPGVLGNDVDANGDPLIAVLVDDVSHGTLALSADGSFVYTPDPTFCGTDLFTYEVRDPGGLSGAATVFLGVNLALVPGSQVTVRTIWADAGPYLVILGTDGADTVALSQSGDVLGVTAGGGTTCFTGPFGLVALYGFGGADTIRMTHSVSVPATVYAGDGNDTVCGAGTGIDTIYGGAGDDLIVTVGGGADVVCGEGGLDSLWVDSTDVAADVSADEISAGAAHVITQFYQPSADPAKYVSLEIDGQDIIDPAAGYSYADFSSKALFVDGPEYNDIRQGSLADCYFLAAIASLAYTDPGIIRQMVAPMGDGTYAVRFFDMNNGGQAVYVRVDAWLPASGSSPAYAKLTPENELWVALTEKAYAQFGTGSNSYPAMGWGSPDPVLQAVTGASTNWVNLWDPAGDVAQALADHLAAGHAVVAQSWIEVTGPFVTSHVYVVKSVEAAGDQSYVTVYNVWGYDGKPWPGDANPNDGLLRVSIAQFIADFVSVNVCMA